jgi:allantoin racemase
MRILVVNPNTSEEMGKGIDIAAKRYANPGTEIVTVCSRIGPLSIESAYEETLAGQGVLERIIEGNKKKFDAIIIACFDDPHLSAARQISEVPVYGIAESAIYMASSLGYKFSIISLLERMLPAVEELVNKIGLNSRCASIKMVEIAALNTKNDQNSTIKALMESARMAIKEDGAEVIILGCAGLTSLDKPMEKELGIPVLDGVVCAVKTAEAIFGYGLKMSKIKAFKKPEPKKFVGLHYF